MHTYKIYSLGCKVNQYDGDKLGGLLKSAGFILVKKGADMGIINTCAVTAGAVRKNKEMIKKARHENPGAKIILTGCWPRVAAKEAAKVGVDLVWSEKNISGLINKLNYELRFKNKEIEKRLNSKFLNLNSANLKRELVDLRGRNQEKSRYFLKIQDGCEQFCSYCIIPFTRGKLQSRNMAEVIAEAEAAVKKGYREIVLCGIHLGLYGINNVDKKMRPRGLDLIKLLKQIIKIEDLCRIRLSSIEITEVSDELIYFMAQEKKMCRHLHIPLQSGCDKILRLMKRPYDLRYFATRIKKIRKKMPDISISTDVIVGFPGETLQDFRQTEKFIKQIKFSRLHVFSFSPHELTAAAEMPGRVDPAEIKKRSQILRNLSEKLSEAFVKKFQGKILDVVVEHNRSSRTGKLKGKKMKGKTGYYFDVFFDKEDIISKLKAKNLIGRVVKVVIPAKAGIQIWGDKAGFPPSRE
jgi:threonylcarbamoyladenosine tRNA methylthiotransferase MtaB